MGATKRLRDILEAMCRRCVECERIKPLMYKTLIYWGILINKDCVKFFKYTLQFCARFRILVEFRQTRLSYRFSFMNNHLNLSTN